MNLKSYLAIAEPSDDGATWWISFPGIEGVTSAASSLAEIVSQAQDALASAVEAGVILPPSIEDGATPPGNLDGFHKPLMVLVPFSAPVTASASAA